jgi:hypothetical protein
LYHLPGHKPWTSSVRCSSSSRHRASPILSRFENAISIKSLKRLRDVSLDQFVASFDTPPRHLTFDLAACLQSFGGHYRIRFVFEKSRLFQSFQ